MTTLLDSSEIKEAASLFGDIMNQGTAAPAAPPESKPEQTPVAHQPQPPQKEQEPPARDGYQYMVEAMTQSPRVEAIEERAAALPYGEEMNAGPAPKVRMEDASLVEMMIQSPSVDSIRSKAAAISTGPTPTPPQQPQANKAYETMVDHMTESPRVESIETKAAALSTEKFNRHDPLTEVLVSMCEKGPLKGALLTDINGTLLSICNNPLNMDEDILAGFTAAMGESLEKAVRLLKLPNANNIYLDINETEKFVLTKFHVNQRLLFLMVICAGCTDHKENINWGIMNLRRVLEEQSPS